MASASQSELARRIRNASPIDREGRYDMASKVECKAYVAEEVAAIEYEIGRIPALEARLAELELSIWAKIKRWFNKISGRIDKQLDSHTKTPPIGVVIKQGDALKLKIGMRPSAALIQSALEQVARQEKGASPIEAGTIL